MFTTFAKATVGAVMALLFFLNHFFGLSVGIDEQTVTTIVDVLIGLLGTLGIYQVENKT